MKIFMGELFFIEKCYVGGGGMGNSCIFVGK